MPQIENLAAYPTTIYVGKDGKVRSVHTGFPSSGSGEELARVKEEIRATGRADDRREAGALAVLTFATPSVTNRTREVAPMDDFRIGSTPPYDAYHDEHRPPDSNRRKPRHPNSDSQEDEVILQEPGASDSEAEDGLGVEDSYTPSDKSEDPA